MIAHGHLLSSNPGKYLAAAMLLLSGREGVAQSAGVEDSLRGRWTATVQLLGDPWAEIDRARLLRTSSGQYPLFRSASSLTPRMRSADPGPHAAFVLPHVRFVHNRDLPFSLNDGALWAGRGGNTDVIAGGRLEWGRVQLFALPELTISTNAAYDVTVPGIFPALPPSRDPWSSPFHSGSQSIDLPIRFGDKPIRRLHPGQSAVVLNAGPADVGAATENEWWGPGLRSALVLSDNAPGFPHLFVRTARPLDTRLGRVEARWMAGGLTDSRFFYATSKESLRQIALLGATIQPNGVEGLTLGAARSVFGPARSWGSALTSFFHVFRDVGQPDARALSDFTAPAGPDQLFSLFMRWVLPPDGFEVYGEWGRAEFPKSLRDFLAQPNHTQAYTLGLQWLGDELGGSGGRLRVQAEATFLQQSGTFQFRPIGSWYTSAATSHGYTQQGQILGAAIGPGSSSQWVAIDHLRASWSIGAYVSRTRWLEDARSQAFVGLPVGNGWCEHDVSLLGGFRGSAATRFGTFGADYSSGWRYNVFFNRAPTSCPFNQGRDVRNQSLSITFAPAQLRW